MDIIVRNTRVSYKAVDVGVVSAPDYLPRFRVTDNELQQRLDSAKERLFPKNMSTGYKDNRKTPTLAKIIMAALGVVLLILCGKAVFKR